MGNTTSHISSATAERAPFYGTQWFRLLERHGVGQYTLDLFCSEIYSYYRNWGREFSWRSELSPYRVLVSEIMLQQTQTGRVEEKFTAFIGRFPDVQALAAARFSEVLRCWKGLGYNRRAKYLHDIAGVVVEEYDSVLPGDPEVLVRFPGIGKATAASICVFAFNQPHAFIETNIRTVFIHFFFPDRVGVADAEIMALLEQTMDRDNPRDWFYALMDYGVMLKKTVGNLSRKSKGYRKQSRFEGSDRQLRGRILDLLLQHTRLEGGTAAVLLERPEARVTSVLEGLTAEGLVVEENGNYRLA
jgi:A/G-specific adenine glycosylase